MAFLKIRQATLTGERKTYVHVSSISHVQEIIPDQDISWQIGAEHSRALIYLHHKLDPIIPLECPEDIVGQVKNQSADSKNIATKLP